MYCPVEMMSTFLSLDIKRMHRNRAAFVSPSIVYSTISLHIKKVYIRTMPSGNFEKCRPAPLMKITKP